MRTLGLTLMSTLVLSTLVSCQQQEVIEETEITLTASKVVVGQDDREQTTAGNLTNPRLGLENGTNYRIRVGQLMTKIPTSTPGEYTVATCSASLINQKFIITAAHCAFRPNTRELLTNTYFYPGIRQKNHVEYGRFPVLEVYLPTDYDNLNSSADKDIAVMKLGTGVDGKEAGSKVGTNGYWGKKEFPHGETLTIGYPGDKEFSTQYFEKGCLVENDYYVENQLEVECDVFKGQSGSPILVYSEEYKNYYIHGVITSEIKSRGVNLGSFLSVERGKIIKSILDGTFSTLKYYKEAWTSREIVHDKEVRVLVYNTCSNRDAYVAYRLKEMNGEWVTRGFFTVKSAEMMELPASPNGVYYLKALDKLNHRSIIEGSSIFDLPGSGNHKFSKYSVQKWGDAQHNLPCAR